MRTSLIMEYSNKLRLSSDPYKHAVYAFVLGIELDELHYKVLPTIEDYLWIQLKMRSKTKQLNMEDMFSTISLRYSVNCLTACKVTLTNFQLLVLTGHIEAAIELLSRTEKNAVHAVHMAIALNELKLLGMPCNELDPLLSSQAEDDSPVCRLNVLRLIITYAMRFEKTDTNEAFNYYFMLRHYKAADGSNLMLKCISDFIVKNCTVEVLSLIFGKTDPCNPFYYSGGILDKLPGAGYQKNALTSMVATELIKRCEYASAIEMYLISFQLNEAMRLTCSILAKMVHLPKRSEGLRKITSRLNLALTSRSCFSDADEFGSFKMLTQLMNFFDSFHAGNFREALEVLDESQLIPQSCQQINICLSSTKVLGADAVQVLPNVLLAAMKILFKEYQREKSPNSATKLQLRERGKALINYVATLPYRMPHDTNKRLVKMELEMQI
ncbi:nuclear pore complex protein Nup93-1-like [Drosophila innubila]|uniref:nuclear pore complex protein Nup93-1-like n=1 Tax=Drosophila innubila TaxID=198719 RepID=UPI00148E4A6F|nr:nuclear pore complex protein Nup93-1-like [Drosophila innubila]